MLERVEIGRYAMMNFNDIAYSPFESICPGSSTHLAPDACFSVSWMSNSRKKHIVQS